MRSFQICFFSLQFLFAIQLGAKASDVKVYTVDMRPPPGLKGPTAPSELPPVFQPPETWTQAEESALHSDAYSLQAPKHWTRMAPKPMQLERFLIKEATEASLARFPGRTGGLLKNINRWLGQLGLPPVEAEGVGALTESKFIEGKDVTLVRLNNPSTQRSILVALHFDGSQSWFFKLEGAQAVVDSEEAVFLNTWLSSFSVR